MRVNQDNESLIALERLEKKIDAISGEMAGIRRHFLWSRIFGGLKFLIIVLPIVLGALYVIPAATKIYDDVQKVLKQTNTILPR